MAGGGAAGGRVERHGGGCGGAADIGDLATKGGGSIDTGEKRATRVVLRRMNREQYSHTLGDLLGLPVDVAAVFPPEGPSADGFTNNGQTLGKQLFGLRVVCDDHGAVSPRRATARELLVKAPRLPLEPGPIAVKVPQDGWALGMVSWAAAAGRVRAIERVRASSIDACCC